MTNAPTYWDYLCLDKLLDLQGGIEGDETQHLPDELHFIIVHQTYELWFKLILRSLRCARDALAKPLVDEQTIPTVAHHLRRVNSILRLGVHQFEVMETLAPQDFLAFRDKLVPSSGFQSFQMREIEILMGLEDAARIKYGGVDPLKHINEVAHDTPAGRLAQARIAGARAESTMLAVLHDWLYRTPIMGSTPGDPNDAQVVDAFITDYLKRLEAQYASNLDRLIATLGKGDAEGMRNRFAGLVKAAGAFLRAEDIDEEHQARLRRVRSAAVFIESYRALPLLAWPRLLLDLVVEMEEQLVLWRHRHARMVERLIGRRVGTGGSGGVDYLDRTGRYRVFRDLWAVRTLLLPPSGLPDLQDPDYYRFMASRET
jgi:tryptophan 2,3-dioxygenase